jgi:CubicO group peptidase (beta-lactamase class C family)
MAQTSFGVPARSSALSLTRRAAMRGIAGGGLVTALRAVGGFDQERAAAQSGTATPIATPSVQVTISDATLRDFEADVEAAMQTFHVPGAAVALVQGNEIVFNRGFGVRNLESGKPVTPRTRFRIGSITKSMTALLLSILVDEGVFGWDDRIVDLWSAFQAPTPELTRALRVRDVLGMGSGIAESTDLSVAAVEFFMSAGTVSAGDVLRSIAALPVIAPPDTTFSYNNSLYAAAAYVGLLAQGTALGMLEETYAAQVRQRVLEPIGMADAAILDDPRPLGEDYAVGYTRDIFGDSSPLPFVSLAGLAPAGSGLASATDMACYLITQMHQGIAPDGVRIVSASNLAEMHRPGISVESTALFPPEVQSDTAALNYGMGWLSETYHDGRQLLWHSGGIDGFAALMGFFPNEQLGYAFLTNVGRGGGLFNLSVQASLLSRLYGLNRELPAFMAGFVPVLEARTAELAAETRTVDAALVTPYLGLYEDGFGLRIDDAGALWLAHDIRSMPLLALPDGTFVVAAGPDVVLAQPVTFEVDPYGVPVMTITGFQPVRWLTGG